MLISREYDVYILNSIITEVHVFPRREENISSEKILFISSKYTN